MNDRAIVRAISKRVASGNLPIPGRISQKTGWAPGGHEVYQFNYTSEAFRSGDMTPNEKACRGLIIRDDGKVMAWPMPKFFNLGEPQCPPLPDMPYEIWEKVDGSLGIFWHDGEFWRCNTRGSFANEYTGYALPEFLDTVPYDWALQRYTYMFEIVMPNDPMRRAVEKEPGIYLLAERNRVTGADPMLPYEPPWGKVKTANRLVGLTIDDLLALKDSKENVEGWVVRFNNGLRVKIKTKWYLRVFRMLQQMTPGHIRDLLLEDEKWVESVPDDLLPDAMKIANAVTARSEALINRVHDAYGELMVIPYRKEFALRVTTEHPGIAKWLFRLRDGKDIVTEIVRTMDVSDLEVE